jgi:hypothetical protein
MIHVVTFCWGDTYSRDYVRKLKAGVERHLKQPHRFICMTDKMVTDYCRPIPPEDIHLTKIKGCFARLCLFDPQWHFLREIAAGDRIVCMDLDAVVTGSLDWLLDRTDQFSILQGVNTTNPCPYNGSLWMLRAGYRPDVYNDFSLEAAAKVPFHSFPDDQGWFHHKMPNAGVFGPENGVYGFSKKGWPGGERLPQNAKFVAFPGFRDPSKFTHVRWVAENWKL